MIVVVFNVVVTGAQFVHIVDVPIDANTPAERNATRVVLGVVETLGHDVVGTLGTIVGAVFVGATFETARAVVVDAPVELLHQRIARGLGSDVDRKEQLVLDDWTGEQKYRLPLHVLNLRDPQGFIGRGDDARRSQARLNGEARRSAKLVRARNARGDDLAARRLAAESLAKLGERAAPAAVALARATSLEDASELNGD